MRKLLWKKLASRRGETLTETLAALLIVGLASGALATMVGAASRMNATAIEKDETLYDAVTAAETHSGAAAGGQVTVTVDGAPIPFDVDYYSDAAEDKPATLYTYRYPKEEHAVKRVTNKLRSRRAMSVTEVLAALAILSLVTLGIAVGVNASLRVYRQSVALSDAQTLSSTLSIAVMDELRYARNVQGTDAPTFDSVAHGAGVTFAANAKGQLTLGEDLLVGEGAYAGLTARLDSFSYDGDFSVALTILDSTGDEIRTVKFSVQPLND